MTLPQLPLDVVAGDDGPHAGLHAPATEGGEGQPALVVDRLTKRFGERTAFSEVSFEVAHGEVFGFLGPNGAGKTTTVRTLGTLIAPTSGYGHHRRHSPHARRTAWRSASASPSCPSRPASIYG